MGDWSGYTTVDGVENWAMHHYKFEPSEEVGHFQSTGRNHDGDAFTVQGTFNDAGETLHVVFDKTYIGSNVLRYEGDLDRRAGIFTGSISDVNPDDADSETSSAITSEDDDAPSKVRKFSFKHCTPKDLRDAGPLAYASDFTRTRKWCMQFFLMHQLFRDETNAGIQLFRVLTPEEFRTLWTEFESEYGQMRQSHHQ